MYEKYSESLIVKASATYSKLNVNSGALRLPSLESDCPHCRNTELARPQFSNITDHEKNIYCTIILRGSNTSPN
jgi:hypothetical protein